MTLSPKKKVDTKELISHINDEFDKLIRGCVFSNQLILVSIELEPSSDKEDNIIIKT